MSKRPLAVTLLFAMTLFLSASLMFVIQPLFGKLLLPLLGGSPAVWNTCMVFYQTFLFLGYLYADLISKTLTLRQQILLHASVLLLSFISLPPALPDVLTPPTEGNPSFWLFGVLTLTLSLPFFVVSTTAPLMQKWFAQLGLKSSQDPYYLYAASNTGSLCALLSYPLFIEPSIGLAQQRLIWGILYGLLCLCVASCAFVLSRVHAQQQTTATATFDEAPTLSTQLRWLALAFVPSSLLLGLTNFISTDIASVPLLWIIPLAVYLLSFIAVFSRWNSALQTIMRRTQAIFLLPFITYAFINPADLPYWAYLILHILGFFFAVMVCHGELAAQRPSTQYLTQYYLIMSFAGMLGGLFNTFAAPFIFNSVYEYPIMVALALLLRPGIIPTHWLSRLLQATPALILLGFGIIMHQLISQPESYFDIIALSLIVMTALVFALRNRPIAYATSYGAIIFLALGLHGLSAQTLYQERTFFGVLSVRNAVFTNEQQQDETYHELFHGTTKHGAERLSKEFQQTPYTYYSRPGPMGQLFGQYDAVNEHWQIGVIGLGAGALTCYQKPGQHWILYELDPLVVTIAKDQRYFHYLSDCASQAETVIGDARLSLVKADDQSFDLLMIDAFSSDSVPTHLLTTEAIQLYLKKLKPNGIVAFHITNRHLLLKKVLSIHAEHLHLAALIQEFQPQQDSPLIAATDWVVLANNPDVLKPLTDNSLGQWQTLPLYFDMQPWTDDYSNIVKIWK